MRNITLDYSFLMKEVIGESGLEEKELFSYENSFLTSRKKILSMHESGELGFLNLPEDRDIVKEIDDFVSSIDFEYENILIVGIGGSSLGIQAIFQALLPYYQNVFGKRKFFFLENVDPYITKELYSNIDLSKSIAIVITKSGSTSETMSHFLILKKRMEEQLGEKAKKRIVVITDPEKGDLLKIAKEKGYKSFSIPQNIGGRFSVLTPVGLLPSAFMGIDIEKILNGAELMKNEFLNKDFKENISAILSSALVEYYNKGKNIFVLMPYSSKLYLLADWFRQLWAESLGKRFAKDGKEIFWGQTPVKSLGAVDQHSQVQLYIEGPKDKVIGFIRVEEKKKLYIPPYEKEYNSTKYLGGKSLSELIDYEQRATALALAKEGRPNFTLNFKNISPETIGEFFMLMEIVTALSGEYINVNTYDQPGVELGKKLTYAFMGRKGYSLEFIENLLSYERKFVV